MVTNKSQDDISKGGGELVRHGISREKLWPRTETSRQQSKYYIEYIAYIIANQKVLRFATD